MKKQARSVTAVAREGGRGASWPGGQATTLEVRGSQATTLEVRGSQATRRRASCYTQQRTCQSLPFIFFQVGFPLSCEALARRKAIP